MAIADVKVFFKASLSSVMIFLLQLLSTNNRILLVSACASN